MVLLVMQTILDRYIYLPFLACAQVVITDVLEDKGTEAAEELNKKYGQGSVIFVGGDLRQQDTIDSKINFTPPISTYSAQPVYKDYHY